MRTLRELGEDALDIFLDILDIFLDITAMIVAFIISLCYLIYEGLAYLLRKIWHLIKLASIWPGKQ